MENSDIDESKVVKSYEEPSSDEDQNTQPLDYIQNNKKDEMELDLPSPIKKIFTPQKLSEKTRVQNEEIISTVNNSSEINLSYPISKPLDNFQPRYSIIEKIPEEEKNSLYLYCMKPQILDKMFGNWAKSVKKLPRAKKSNSLITSGESVHSINGLVNGELIELEGKYIHKFNF